ncbi:hypothetical protein BGZ95_009267 [Linnemannia exigua]|uniref:F-box domain-containing protein n=1 Tax=Linnemannia exigua TaxID=604196 RepID=A0AAD4DD37_9FUNG|nr:hypothetical protein BGZ95_009267 [Linnemannia exigua]
MNRLFKKKHTLPLSYTTPPPAPSITNIPEILEVVFSYLDNTTLRKTCLLVCRQWHQLTHSHVLREVRWDWRWKRHKIGSALSRLAGAHRLICTCISVHGYGEVDVALSDIMRAINQQATDYQAMLDKQSKHGNQQDQYQEQQQGGWRLWWQQGESSLKNIRPLREVELFSFRQPGGDNLTKNVFHFPATLTSLKFTGGVYSGTRLWVDQILTDCPLLEVFHAGSGGPILVNGLWVPPNYDRKRSLRLRSLVLQNAMLDQAGLEDLLSITPLLQELKLIELLSTTQFVIENLTLSYYDWNRLYRRLKSLALPLRALQFTVYAGSTLSHTQLRQRMIELCPNNTSEWSFAPADISLTLLQELSVVHNDITTLELCIRKVWPRNFSACTIGRFSEGMRLLHRYLCDSPNLVKLKCISGAIFLDELDLFDRAKYTDLALGLGRDWSHRVGPTVRSNETKKKVWACRNLRSLEVEVHSHGYERLIWPVQSRILFGYIATVCPELEELDLKLSSYCLQDGADRLTRQTLLHIQLEGGLCLLSKMEYLRTLKIDRGSGGSQWLAKDIQKFDINWIVPSEINRDKNRTQRRRVVEQWRQNLEAERQLEVNGAATSSPHRLFTDRQSQQHQSNVQDELGLGNRRYEELKDSLATLGLLSEVKRVVESMDLPEFRCFPSLERLSFGGAFEQRPVDEIKRIFPRWYQGG